MYEMGIVYENNDFSKVFLRYYKAIIISNNDCYLRFISQYRQCCCVLVY